MNSILVWLALMVAAYLIGAVPLAQIAAKLARGIDLKQYGTGQVGAGNLFRMTSWKWAVPVAFFDTTKGLWLVWLAGLAGLSVAQQLAVGLAAMAGHNWSVFLRFDGGRGLGTACGIVIILPIINHTTPWTAIVFVSILIAGTIILRSSPLPALVAVLSLPVVSGGLSQPLEVTLGYLGVPFITIVKRLTAPQPDEIVSSGRKRLMLNRLLFDRDIADRDAWMYRGPAQTPEESESDEVRRTS